jgi:hypothetical protein
VSQSVQLRVSIKESKFEDLQVSSASYHPFKMRVVLINWWRKAKITCIMDIFGISNIRIAEELVSVV